jgi:hypothetical protein
MRSICGGGLTAAVPSVALLVKDDAEIVFDGVPMVVPTDENGVCD